jgi:hypothetical protein
MLFLFSDVTELDAPTRIAVGSHLEVAKGLEPYGEDGLSVMELAASLDPDVRKARDARDRRGRHGIPVSSASPARSPAAPWKGASVHGPAAARPCVAV